MSAPLRYSTDDMDHMVRTVTKYHHALRKAGHLDHLNRPTAQAAAPPDPVTHDGYCLKCRKNVTVDTEGVDTGGKAHRATGTCPTCSTKVHRFLSPDESTQLQAQLSDMATTGGTI